MPNDSEFRFREPLAPTQFNFGDVGTLYLESPLRFEGDVEESAKVFFEYLAMHGVTVEKLTND